MVTLTISSRLAEELQAEKGGALQRFGIALQSAKFDVRGWGSDRVEGVKRWPREDFSPAINHELYRVSELYHGDKEDLAYLIDELDRAVGWIQLAIWVPCQYEQSAGHPGESSGSLTYDIVRNRRSDRVEITLRLHQPGSLNIALDIFTDRAYSLVKEVAIYRLASEAMSKLPKCRRKVELLTSALAKIQKIYEEGVQVDS